MIDLTVAFETLCTSEILPAKLTHYGATNKTRDFFKAYFNGRKHFVELPNGTKSKVTNLHNYSLDVLWCQPIKLIHVVSTSEFHEY